MKLARYIQSKVEEQKVELHTTSVNIEKVRHLEFLRRNKLELGTLVRDMLDELMEQESPVKGKVPRE